MSFDAPPDRSGNDWEQVFPTVIDFQARDAISELVDRFSSRRTTILFDVLSHAYRLEAKTAIMEVGYIDRDFRSEYSAFYASAFRQMPSVARRLHFFADPVPEDFFAEDTPASLAGLTYLGYIVLRPVRAAPVGRTMLVPTREQAENLTCIVRETVNVFGADFTVEGMPFIAQDAHFGVCAHADAWMISYYHHLRYRGAPRVTPAQLVGASGGNHGPFPLAAAGIKLDELRAMLGRASLPTLLYPLKILPGDTHRSEIICRYLDSGLPVVLAEGEHVVTAIGYRRKRGLRPKIELLVHDDEQGPYRQLGEREVGANKDWTYLIVPLPEKIWTAADVVEVQAERRARFQLKRTDEGNDLLHHVNKKLTWRTVCVESNEFKATLTARGCSAEVAVHYQRMPMSRWIWVVELVDRKAHQNAQVVGELIVDCTNHSRDADVLAWRLADQFYYWEPTRSPVPVNVDPHSHMSLLRPRGRNWS